jgi:two-component system alkaline phosphatase synthesis response regulator PhoP
MPETILIVEDEASIRNILQVYLEQENFRVICTDNGLEALAIASQQQPDLIVLDLNLPGMDGMEVTARLRQKSDVYILMLTARSEEADKIAGLRLGADDYLTKPFSPKELVARVQAILRRLRSPANQASTPDNILCFETVQLNLDRHEAQAGETLLDLTTTEFNVLLELARHAGRVLTREQLMDRVWGQEFYGTDRVVDVFVGQVRRKLEQVTGQTLIQTVRGVGYKFIDTAL